MPIGYGQVNGRKYHNLQKVFEKEDMRYCNKCHQLKPRSEFGAHTHCKKCVSMASRDRRARMAAQETKRCKQCGVDKPLSQYEGSSDVCRLCKVLEEGDK